MKKHAMDKNGWRVQGMKTEADVKPLGAFDEIVVGHWLHVEMMDKKSAFVRLGDHCFWIRTHNGKIAYAECRPDGDAYEVEIVRKP